jgi:putative type I site-specific restriction-modification system, S subunit
MRRYESYKDSGVEWLGEVPSHWELGRISTYFTERRTKVSDKDYPALSVTKLGVFPQWENVAKTNDGDNRKLAKKGDFVINSRSDRKGSSGIAKQDGSVSLINIVLQPKKINSVYSEYLFKSYSFIEEFYRVGHGIVADLWTTRFEDIKNSLIIFPPLSEQQKIAQFLDDKIAKIDQAVDLAEKQIALLKEHKQILIQNAVTRGLNPDVPLKDSGVEWIGQVPEHWEVKRFRNLFDFGKGLSITKENLQDEGIPCVNYGEIHSKYGFEVIPERDALKCVDSKYLVFNNSMLNKGDFVFADTSEDIEGSGNFTYLNSSTRIFAGYHTVITRLKITAIHRYIAYYFDSLSFRNQIRNKVKGVKVFSITQSILKGTFVLLPNLKEQQKIADYLDTQTAKIDQAIALKTAHIEKLKEYKSVLINDVVTGKVRVSV